MVNDMLLSNAVLKAKLWDLSLIYMYLSLLYKIMDGYGRSSMYMY